MTFSKGTKKRPTYQRSSGTANTEGPFEVATKFFWDCTTTAKETRTNMRRALKNYNFFSAPGYVRASTL